MEGDVPRQRKLDDAGVQEKRPSFSAATAKSRLRLPNDASSVANQIAACVSSSSTT